MDTCQWKGNDLHFRSKLWREAQTLVAITADDQLGCRLAEKRLILVDTDELP